MPEDHQAKEDPQKAAANHKSRFRRNLPRIIVIVAVVSAYTILLLLSIYVPYLTERIKFFTVNALSLSILVAVIVQAVIYSGQWNVMQEGLKETRISRELENAAIVGIKGASFTERRLYVGQWQRIHVTIVNTGRTPAFNLRVSQDWAVSPMGPADFRPPNAGLQPKNQSTVMPNTDAVISFVLPEVTQDDFDAINNFQRFIYVWGTIEYSDIFAIPHWTKFCLMHHPTTNVFDSGHGNECDYQYQRKG